MLARNKNPAKPTSRTRLPTICAVAAHMPASCARSSAPPTRCKGGDHEYAVHSLAPRCSQDRFRRARSSASRLPALLSKHRAGRRQAGHPHRGRYLPGDRQRRQGDGLFRQGRVGHRRLYGAATNRRRRARRADGRIDMIQGDTCSRPTKARPGAAYHSGRRRAIAPGRGGGARGVPRRRGKKARRRGRAA